MSTSASAHAAAPESTDFHRFLLAGLTDEQAAAVTAPTSDSLLIRAGAGTGKTRTLIARTAWLAASGIPLRNILLITFTNRAAREMIDRLYRIFLDDDAENPEERARHTMPTMGTFHAIAARFLRQNAVEVEEALGFSFSERYTIVNEEDARRLIKDAAMELLPAGSNAALTAEDAELIQDAMDKHACVDPEPDKLADLLDLEQDDPVFVTYRIPRGVAPIRRPASAVIRTYLEYKARNHLLDYNDLIAIAVRTLRANPRLVPRRTAVLCDEYQDTNALQEEFLHQLRGPEPLCPVTCVGDDAQLLYAWRGAHIENILELPDRIDCHVAHLTLNFRSPQSILDAANAALAANKQRRKTELVAAGGQSGHPVELHVFASAREEADYIVRRISERYRAGASPGDYAVLARTGRALSQIDGGLARAGVPYRVTAGRRFANRAEIRDAAAWISLIINPADNTACERALQRPKRGIGKTSIERIRQTAIDRRQPMIDTLQTVVSRGAIKGRPAAAVRAAHELYRELASYADRQARPDRVLSFLLEKTGLYESITEHIDDPDPDERQAALDRKERFDQLMEIAREHRSIMELAEHLAIADTPPDASTSSTVTLSTVHAAKGCEWSDVHLVALEEGVLPVSMDDLEEERRILHVACSRAKDRLTLSRCRVRQESEAEPSRFIDEIRPHLQIIDHPEP